MGQVGWGFVVDQANTSTGSASGEVGIAAASGGIYSPTLQTAGMGGSGVTNTYNGPLNNLLIRPYLFANGEQGWWYDPSDVNLAWRRNLLTRTEEFDNAVWTKSATITLTSGVLDPFGGSSAFTVAASGGAGAVQQAPTVTSGVSLSASIWIRRRTGTGQVFMRCGDITSIPITVTSNWERVPVSATPTSTSGRMAVVILDGDAVDIYGAQLEVGSLTTYQQIVTPEITYVQDVQPLPILYQDAAGTTPVTAVEQPCSLMLDKRLGLTLGSELVAPLDFTSGWADFSITSDTSNSFTTSATGGKYKDVVTTGKWYRLSGNISTSAGTLAIWNAAGPSNQIISTTSGVNFSVLFYALTDTIYFRVNAAATVTVNSISHWRLCKQIVKL